MDAKKGAASPVYEDFVPSSELVQEEDCDTLILYLPGFKREQLRVQLTRGILRISGSRPIGDNKWSRFQKEYPVSANCEMNKITAKFEGGIMYVRQPKLITPADKQDEKLPPSVAPESLKPAVEPQAPKDAPEQASQKASQRDDPTQQTADNNVPEKAQEKIEEKTTDAKNGKETNEEKKASLPEKSSDEKNGRNEVKEKNTNDKPKTDSINAVEKKDNGTSGNEDGAGKTSLANYRDISGAMAARLTMPRRVMNAVLVVLLALLLGLYVNNWIRSFREAEN